MGIGDRIKERRIHNKMSQDELAKKMGYHSKSSISRIELNKQNLSQNKIAEFARVLETTPSYLMGWTDSPEPDADPLKNMITATPSNLNTPEDSDLNDLSPNFVEAVKAMSILDVAELRQLISLASGLVSLKSITQKLLTRPEEL